MSKIERFWVCFFRLSRVFMIVLLAVWGAGCAGSAGRSGGSAGGALGLRDPESLAAYLRQEPSVRQVEHWENPYGPGLVVSTAHYRLYTTHLEPLTLRQMPAFLESAFRAYQSQLPEPLACPEPFVVYLFGTRAEWEAFTIATTGADAAVYLKIQAGAYAVEGRCVAYDIGRRPTFSVIGHEGWHQFNQKLFVYRLPSWLDEGIATLFETCRYEQGRFVFDPGSNLMRLGGLKQTLQAGRMIPLEQLLALNPGQVIDGYEGDPNGALMFYSQVYGLARFLREERYGIRLRAYHGLLMGAAHGDWPLEARLLAIAADRRVPLTVSWNQRVSRELFAHYFGDQWEAMDREYRAFCGKITYPVRLGK